MLNKKDDEYFTQNFNKLVKKYGGKWVIIIHGKKIGLVNKEEIRGKLDEVRKKYPNEVPMVAPIPTKEEIQCIL